MSEHAVIAPSSLATIVECPGSLALSRANPQPESDSEKEGRIAHHVAMLYATAEPGDHYPVLADTIDGVRVTEEMIAGAKMYAEALEGFAGHAEQRVNIARIHPTLCWGTPDFWQYSPATKVLRVTDYKFGFLYVDVFENWQLIAYAAGIIDELVASRQAAEFEIIVEFVIVQPRCYSADSPVRTWTTSATNLRPYVNRAFTAVAEALGENPPTKAGPHCLFCPGRAICNTAHKASTAIIEYAGRVEALAHTPAELGLRLALIHTARKMLEGLETGLEAQAMARIRKGESVPYFKIGYTKPRQQWTKPVAEVKLLGQMAKVALTEETYAMTPKQAIAAGIDAAVINAYSSTPHGSAKLVPDDLTNAARIFKK